MTDKKIDRDPEEERRKERGEILCKIQDILKAHRGEESNIPITSDYWTLLNRYRYNPADEPSVEN